MIEAKVTGIPDLKRELAALPDKLRKQAIGNALRAAARIVRDEARRKAPVLSADDPKVIKGFRKPGTLKKAISVRTSKRDRRLGDVGAFVNVRPAKGAERGTNKPADPFYWRWVEFGRQARKAVQQDRRRRAGVGRLIRARRALRSVGPMRAVLFLSSAASALPRALQTFLTKASPAIQRLLNKQTP